MSLFVSPCPTVLSARARDVFNKFVKLSHCSDCREIKEKQLFCWCDPGKLCTFRRHMRNLCKSLGWGNNFLKKVQILSFSLED
jgi:hypothetical protein